MNNIDFKTGIDVEFLMLNHVNNLVAANDFFENERGAFGRDANGRNFEIRSKASENPVEVVSSIQKVMQKTVNEIPELFQFKWVGGSFVKNLPIGVHFHFGVKKLIDPHIACNYLDNYLGAISLLLENRQQGIGRRKYNKSPGGNAVSYGKQSDFRLKRHGFEYRPVSSNIQSPYILLAFVCLGKALIYEALNNKSFVPSKYIEPVDFVEMNTSKLRCLFPSMWSEIRKLKLYPKYKQYLELIPKLVNNNLTWLVPKNGDFKHNWGIINPSYKKKKPAPITLETIWNDFMKANNVFRVVAEEKPVFYYRPLVIEREDMEEENKIGEILW